MSRSRQNWQFIFLFFRNGGGQNVPIVSRLAADLQQVFGIRNIIRFPSNLPGFVHSTGRSELDDSDDSSNFSRLPFRWPILMISMSSIIHLTAKSCEFWQRCEDLPGQ
jgi:hypothetical protein